VVVLACLYDVHGNLPALEAVLADVRADGYVLGGDYALFGAWPAETVARLQELDGAVWIRGNGERWTGAPQDAPDWTRGAIDACAEALGSDLTAALAALPADGDAADWMIVHGSPLSDVRSFAPEATDEDAELLAGAAPARLVFGHTHVPFARRTGETLLVNPGSVGMPFDGDPRAAYALIDGDRVEHRRVEYDHRASAAAVRALGGEWAQTVAQRIETASFA
jgi:diadenosine tetraphosphatase ApaH/serine/threonine PP2A family protein phosphatase